MTKDLKFDDVTIVYGRGRHAFTAVRDFSLDVPAGSVMGIVGESGSGKSTLAKATVGLVGTRGGAIQLDGTTLKSRKSRRAIQMVFQDPYASLNPRMTIGASIKEGLSVNKKPEFTVPQLLQLIGLDADRAGQLPKDFSGGQRQRIALARALASGPDVLIADEITSALDVSVQGSVINLLLDLQRRIGFSVLFISHDLPVVRYVSDRIAVMYRGELVEVGDTDQIVHAPAHPYTIQLLEASSALSGV